MFCYYKFRESNLEKLLKVNEEVKMNKIREREFDIGKQQITKEFTLVGKIVVFLGLRNRRSN